MRRFIRLVRVVSVALFFTAHLSIVVRRLPVRERLAYRAKRQQEGLRRICNIIGLKVRLDGTLPLDRGMLVVSNHIGVLDILTLGSQIPAAIAGKAELAEWPVIGWVTRVMGVLFVERTRRSQASSFVREVRERLEAGVQVIVFPEGRTGRGPGVRPFKTGSFAAVEGSGAFAVLPLYLTPYTINGRPVDEETRSLVTWADTTQSFGAHAWQIFGLDEIEMLVRVGKPIESDGLDRKALAECSREQIGALAEYEQG